MTGVSNAQVLLVVVATSTFAVAQSRQTQAPAVPVDPTTLVLNAFGRHTVVALGEGPHDNRAGHSFRLSLIRDPRFATVVSDIVVEAGSAT